MALYAGFHNQIRPRQGRGGDFVVNRQATDLAYKKDMAGTFATQFISGSPEADRQTQGREEDTIKGGFVCKSGIAAKRENTRDYSRKVVKRAGGICVGSAWRFEVKRGNRVSRFVCHYVQGCGLKPDFPSQPAWLLRVLSLCFPVVPERQNRAIMTRCLKSLLGSLGRRWLIHI